MILTQARFGTCPSDGFMAGFTPAKSLVILALVVCSARYAQGDLYRVGKAVPPLQRVKTIRIAVSTVKDKLGRATLK